MRDLITALTQRRPIENLAPVPYGDSSRSGFRGLFSRSGPEDIGERSYGAYGSVGTLFSIIHQITEAFCTAEWHLYQRTSVRDKKKRKEVLNHGFMTVWDKPNPFYTGRMFRESCAQHLELVGETIFVLQEFGGVVYEMWCVRPDKMQPIKHPTKFLAGWVYIGPDGEEVPLRTDQVIQIKYPNPSDPYRGMGPVQSVLNDIDAAKYSAEWNKNFFINGAQPGGAIEIDYTMTDGQFNAFMARWQEQHQGVANAHQVALLEGGAKWKDTKFSMSDMQFVELRNLPRELVREAFAFPKPMLGTVDDVNRANSDAAKEIMAENQTNPRLNRWKDAVDNFLLPRFANGKSLELDYDDPTPVNHEATDRERNSMWTAAKNGVFAGFEPDDVTDAVGLPRMRWKGIPSSAGASGGGEDDNTGTPE